LVSDTLLENGAAVGQITPTRFGEWSLVRERGCIGSPGTVRLESFASEDQARAEEQRTVRAQTQHQTQQSCHQPPIREIPSKDGLFMGREYIRGSVF